MHLLKALTLPFYLDCFFKVLKAANFYSKIIEHEYSSSGSERPYLKGVSEEEDNAGLKCASK